MKMRSCGHFLASTESVKSVRSTLSHLISTSVSRATLPAFSWSMNYFNTIYFEQTDLGVEFHKLINNLKPLTFRIKTFQLLLFSGVPDKREQLR